MEQTLTPRLCRLCSAKTKLRRNVIANGTSQVFWYCDACGMMTPPGAFLPHAAVAATLDRYGTTIEALPIILDYRVACAICGALGAEYHHFLPQMFADHDEVLADWPAWSKQGANLCKYHHDLWHDLVTFWMPGRGNSRKLILDKLG